jgi:hypothetical protein
LLGARDRRQPQRGQTPRHRLGLGEVERVGEADRRL